MSGDFIMVIQGTLHYIIIQILSQLNTVQILCKLPHAMMYYIIYFHIKHI